MTNALLAALVLSSLLHAAWNLAARRWRHLPGFVPAACCWGWLWAVALLPLSAPHLSWTLPTLGWAGVSSVGLAIYLFCLNRAYAEGDISVAYPIIRSSPLWVSLVSVTFLGEHLSAAAWFGILLTLFGVTALPLRHFSLHEIAALWAGRRGAFLFFALGASLGTVIYTLSDNMAMVHAQGPLAGAAFSVLLFPPALLLWRWASPEAFRGIDWKRLTPPGLPCRYGALFGLCIFAAYALVVGALIFGDPGRVLAVTNLGVVLGALGGIVFFHERTGLLPRLAGLALTVAGITLLRLF